MKKLKLELRYDCYTGDEYNVLVDDELNEIRVDDDIVWLFGMQVGEVLILKEE